MLEAKFILVTVVLVNLAPITTDMANEVGPTGDLGRFEVLVLLSVRKPRRNRPFRIPENIGRSILQPEC